MKLGLIALLLMGTFHTSQIWAADADDTTDALQAAADDSAAAAVVDSVDERGAPGRGGGGGGFNGGGHFNPGPQPGRPEPGRPDPGRPDPVRPTPINHPAPAPTPPRPFPGRPQPGPVRPEPGRPDPGRPGVYHGPINVSRGNVPWRRWDHPIFNRPVYAWNWAALRLVTCTAQDSYGDQYPVTEDGYYGAQYQTEISQIEDDALDRCYDESNGDSSCFLVSCTPGY